MAGYAVSGRIQRAAIHTGRAAFPWSAADRGLTDPPGDRTHPTSETEGSVAVDLVGRPFEAVVAERLAAAREAWTMATFYLFDAEGWR